MKKLALNRGITSAVAITTIFVFLTGCATSLAPSGIASPQHPMDYAYADSGDMKKKIQDDLKKIDQNESKYYLSNEDNVKRALRDETVSIYLKHIDEFWRQYRSSFFSSVAASKTGFESSSGLLAGAAAITTPANASQLLAAISSGVTLVGTSVQKNFLQENTADLLLSQMEADRQAISLRIKVGLTKDTKEYPLVQARSDVDEYALSLSIPSALASLRASAGAALQATKNTQNQNTKADIDKDTALKQAQGAQAEVEKSASEVRNQQLQTQMRSAPR